MTAQVTDRVLTCYRIGDPNGQFPIFDDKGSELYPSRWNTASSPILYTCEHFSTAMLEKLVHAASIMPENQHYIEITIPNGTSYESFDTALYPDWSSPDERRAKAYGEGWIKECRSAILIVPSLPARVERNFLINLAHPEAGHITHSLHQPIWWDERLFN